MRGYSIGRRRGSGGSCVTCMTIIPRALLHKNTSSNRRKRRGEGEGGSGREELLGGGAGVMRREGSLWETRREEKWGRSDSTLR